MFATIISLYCIFRALGVSSYLQVPEGVEEEPQRESGLVEQSLGLRYAAQGTPERPDEQTQIRQRVTD